MVAEKKTTAKKTTSKKKSNVEAVMDSLEQMTVLELAELVKGMEEKFEHTTMSGAHINKSEYQCSDGAKRTGVRQATKNNHPTVKPIALFEWLIKLVTREGQIILDPFLGSGTTAIAAHNTGRLCVGIEKEPEYIEIAKRRVDYWKSQPRQQELQINA